MTRTIGFLVVALLIPATGWAQQVDLTAAERAWMAAHPVIRLGIDNEWRPVEFSDEGVHRGFTADYLALLNERLGANLTAVVGLTWAQVMEAARSRELDGVACAVETPERSEYLLFTTPYLDLDMVVFARDDAPAISGLAALRGRATAVVEGYAQHEILQRDYPEVDLVTVSSAEEGLRALATGRVEALVESAVCGTYFIQERGYTNLKVAAVTSLRYQLAFGVRDDWPVLATILEKGVGSITQEERQAIVSRWVGVQAEADLTMVWRIGGGIALVSLALVAGTLLWNRQARRRGERFRSLLESTPDGMIIFDGQGGINLVNGRTEQLFGYRREDLIGASIERLLPGRFWEGSEASLDQDLHGTGQSMDGTLEATASRQDGSRFPAEISLSRISGERTPLMCAAVRDITDRRQAEEALTEAEERGRLLLESVGEGIVGVDEDGRITFLNPAAARLLAYGTEELLGRPVHGAMHHSRADGAEYPLDECPMHRAYTEGVPVQADGEILWRKDGSRLTADCTATPMRHQGRLVGAVITLRDISERLSAEAALREQREELQRVARLRESQAAVESSLAALTASLQGNLAVEEAAQRALDEIVEFLGAPMGAVYVPEDDGQLHRRAAHALPPGAAGVTSFRMGTGTIGQVAQSRQTSTLCPDESTWSLSFGLMQVAPKLIVTMPLLASEDLSGVLELYLLEDLQEAQSRWLDKASNVAAVALRLARESQEREAAEERTRQILESTGEGLFGLDRSGRATFVNPAASQMLGYSPEELVGQGTHAIIHHSHADGTPYPVEGCPMREAFTEGVVTRVDDEVLWHKDGRAIPVEYTSTPILKDGVILGAVISFRDVTERREADTPPRRRRLS